MNTEPNEPTAPIDGADTAMPGTPETAAPVPETAADASAEPPAPPEILPDPVAETAPAEPAEPRAAAKLKPPAGPVTDPEGERIAKVLARAGLCSRREAEAWVAEGRVAVNGVVLTTPAVTVGPRDRVSVDGTALPVKERTRLWLFHKPRGLVTTTHDPEGRPTVFSVLPEDMPRVITIGRLDINTEGLLLLTNDGGLARVLELPSTGWLRRYRVRAFGTVEQRDLDELKHGVSLDGIDYGPIEATVERVQGSNTWLVLGLREGKNREVKRVLGTLGLAVNRLIRVSFGPFQLADLEEGEIREIRGRVLRDQLGKRLVAESGADFEAPVVHHIPGEAESEEAPKRRIRGFDPDARTPARGGGPRERKPRTKMEFIGTGEKRRREGDEPRGGRDGEGPRGRPRSGEAPRGRFDRGGDAPRGRSRSGEGRNERFERSGDAPRGRSWSGEGRDGRTDRGGDAPPPRGFRDRQGEGFGGGRPIRGKPSEGHRGHPGGGGRAHGEGFRDRAEGERPRGGFRDRPEGERPSRSFRDRPESERPQRGFRDRPEGERPQGEGFRGRGGEGAAKSGGFRGRPEGGAGKGAGFKTRPEGASFGPRGPRGMNPGGRTGPKGAGGPPRGGKGGPGRGGGGPKGGGRGGPRGGA